MDYERSNLEDQLLVMDAQDGKAEAMELLVKRWQKRLWQHSYRLTGNPDAAWDITQQAWLGIIKGLNKLHDPAHFRAWVYRITTNKAVTWIKRHKKDKMLSIDRVPDIPQPQTESGLQELLDQLELRQRLVLSLHYFEQLSVPEISLILRIPEGTIKSRLFTARNELRTLLNEEKE